MRVALSAAKLPKTTIALVASLLIGFALGSAIYGLSASRTAPRVSDAEYVLMVADLYDHEKSVYNARERLTQIGQTPIDTVEAAVETYAREHPEARRDVDALRQLAVALRQAEVDGARSVVPVGTIAVVLLVAISIILGAGAAWLWKRAETRGLRLPLLPANGTAAPEQSPASRSRLGRFASALATTVGTPRPSSSTRARSRRPATVVEPNPDEAGSEGRGRAAVPVAAAARPRFECNYALGDDPYDAIHPIHDANGDLIGACGLSATEPGDRPGRYFGFTAWLQDYSGGSELSALGLVTRAGQIARAAGVNEWLRRGTIDDILPVERGAEDRLETSNIAVRLTVVDSDYAPPTTGSPGYFGRLSVQLEVL